MGVRPRAPLVHCMDDEAVTSVNSETGFGSLRMVKGADRLIYISNHEMAEGHR
jgi:hypothetical protein